MEMKWSIHKESGTELEMLDRLSMNSTYCQTNTNAGKYIKRASSSQSSAFTSLSIPFS